MHAGVDGSDQPRSPGMGRSPCCEKVRLKKGPWTPEEDQKLLAYIEEHGHGSWRALPAKAGLHRCGKSCRLRWTNYLRPDIKRGKFSLQEEQTIIQLHALLGNRWSAIATHLPKRTDNEIKNYWNTHLKKRLTKMGIDPVTHKPNSDALGSADGQSKSAANLNHMAQWESARLEAEARLAKESKLRSSSIAFHQQQSLGSSTYSSPSPASAEPNGKPAIPLPPPPCLDVFLAWQRGWNDSSKPGQGPAIDLESPTSTLSFSSNMMQPVTSVGLNMDIYSSTLGDQGGQEEEEVEWKCYGKPMNMLGTKDQMEDSLTMDPTVFGVESAWLSDSSMVGTGSGGDFGAGLLLDESNDQNSAEGCGESDNAEGCSSLEEEEEDKKYWNSILNLVNSSSPSRSPPPVF